ncbi:DNA polymerase/3'-5' exonuclease PolX [Candidatus Zixiibacteriota bacterium]
MSVNVQLAALFSEIALLLELQESNPFRIRAYRRVAQVLESFEEDLAHRADEGTLLEIPGVGKDISAAIQEFLQTGVITELFDLRASVPPILVQMTTIPGLGPKKALKLHQELGLEDLDELAAACNEGAVAALPGFGEKSQQNILKGIDFVRRVSGIWPLGQVLPAAEAMIETVGGLKEVEMISIAGSLRRMKETVGDVDIVAGSLTPEPVMQAFTSHPVVGEVLAHGPTKSSVRTHDDLQIDLRVVPPEVFGAALMHFTGSREHNIRLREMATKQDIRINEYGIFDVSGLTAEEMKGDPAAGRRLGADTEASCFEALGLPFIPPELREDTGEIQAALAGTLPELIEVEDIKGEIHAHTDASDGRHTLEELIGAVRERGLSYIAVTDHSKSLTIAGGLDIDRMKWQIDRVREADTRHPDIRIFTGTEVDILKDGSLDYPDDLLAELDIVIASIHSRFGMSGEEQTRRICDAMENPYVGVIGHLTGRMLGERDAYELDIEQVIESAARTRTALEINAHPKRLDLNDRHARMARKAGAGIVICTDTHRPGHLDFMHFGVKVARRAWLGPADILNTLEADALLTELHRKRE